MVESKTKFAIATLVAAAAATLVTVSPARAADDPVGMCEQFGYCSKGTELCATIEVGQPPVIITYYCYAPRGDM